MDAREVIGVDTGGTFTDLIAFDHASGALQRAKVPSVPGDPSLAVIDALEKLFRRRSRARRYHHDRARHDGRHKRTARRQGRPRRPAHHQKFRAVYEARRWSQPREADLLDTFLPEAAAAGPQYLTEEASNASTTGARARRGPGNPSAGPLGDPTSPRER
jgi:N-methylhydantoinase A